jgi:hypothetical protein
VIFGPGRIEKTPLFICVLRLPIGTAAIFLNVGALVSEGGGIVAFDQRQACGSGIGAHCCVDAAAAASP